MLLVVSSFALALLGLAIWSARAALRAGDVRLRASERRERFLLGAVAAMLEASRQSSQAVLGALDRSLREFDADLDAVLVFVPVGDELACRHSTGSRAEHFQRMHLRRASAEYLPVKAANVGCRALLSSHGGGLLPTDRAALAAPMLDASGLRGVVYIASALPGALREQDTLVRAIEHAAAPYALALEREADRAEATYDSLTGALTPRAFRQRLREEMERKTAGRHDVLSLWFIDTDRFKSVNDRFGHRSGDLVLQAMAALLQDHLVAELDLAARNGGDEFCALIRGTGKSAAIERAQGFCDAVRAFDFGVPIPITASIGVATFPYDAVGSSALLEAADAAMYHSKRNGRDRVSFAVEPGEWASFAP